MPPPTNTDELLDLVRKSEVVDENRLTNHLAQLRAQDALPTEPGVLAGALVRDGLLTHFQAEQLLQGKWRRFTIGKYKVLERLGAGGMGSVYLCEHKLMRRRVAVKVLPVKKADDPSSLERFHREARAVAALDHPNIVRAYDIDQDDKLHFLVMEYVNGASLHEIVKKAGPLDPLRACHYIRQAALGLQHAHATAGIVHRDIKPGNILVDRNGVVKVLDMGLARFFHDEEDALTVKFDENVLGTADYLAPEQALDSHTVDIRADIYSLGATFYYCLTGKPPFAEGTVAQKLIWHQTRQPRSVRELRPEVPAELEAIVQQMMAKAPEQRFQLPEDIARVLEPWTRTPIPPPPEHEMPQLSLAALGPGTTNSLGSSPTSERESTPPSSKRTWAVRQAGPPTPSSSPTARPARPEPPAPPPASPSAGPAFTSPPPEVRPPSRPSPPPVPTLPPQAVATLGESREEEHLDFDLTEVMAGTDSGRRSRTPSGGRSRSGRRRTPSGIRVPPSSRRAWWVVGVVTFLAVGCIGAVLAWSFVGPGPTTDPPSGSHPTPAPTLVVNRDKQGEDVFGTLTGALREVQNRQLEQGVRIVVETDLAEHVVVSNLSNVTIEAMKDREVVWRPGSKARARSQATLLTLGNAPGCTIKGLTLDGEGQADALINLWGESPGLTLEGLSLKGYRKYGVWITNTAGGEGDEEKISLRALSFTSAKKGQIGVYFDLVSGLTVPTNKHIVVQGCAFGRSGTRVATSAKNAIDDVDFPGGKIIIHKHK